MFKKNLIGLLACIIFTFISCSKNDGKTPIELGNELGILHKGNGGEPADIDPHVTTGIPEYHIQKAIFEPLITKDDKTLDIKPAVAKSWEISEDQKTYTFYLRHNAKWSNGDTVTANDFLLSWQRALLPELGNQYAYSLFVIKNAKAFHEKKITDFSQVGIKALNNFTLQITLNYPTPYFLQLLDHHSMYPVHINTIKKFGAVGDRGTRWTRPENFVGNGAFTIKQWQPNKVFSVKRNDYYWDKSSLSLNEIHFYPVQHKSTEERMFRAGQLHVTSTVPEEKLDKYKTQTPRVLRTHPYFGTYFYRFNTTIKPLNDARVRKALSFAIDRKKLTEKVTKGGQPEAYALTPPNTNGYSPRSGHESNIDKAKALLTEAGYPNGEGFPTLDILYNTSEGHRKIALAIQQMWKTNLGINVTMQNQDWKVYLNSQRTMNYQITRASWIGDYYDPNTFLDMFVTDGGNNETGWSNTSYDELIEKASKAGSQQERYEFFMQAEDILVEEAPIMPVYTYTRQYLIQPSVKGWTDNILDYQSYKSISLETL